MKQKQVAELIRNFHYREHSWENTLKLLASQIDALYKQPINQEKIQLLYCKWCPYNCKKLTKKEKLGCLASGGFYDDLPDALYQITPEQREKIEEIIFVWEGGKSNTIRDNRRTKKRFELADQIISLLQPQAKDTCPLCMGNCPECGGSGIIPNEPPVATYAPNMEMGKKCPACNGTGKVKE
jgi:protein-arginine kinase activator protein McsA